MTKMKAGSDTWRSLGQNSLVERIREEILRMIEARNLQAGDQLPAERELAAALAVSRPSIREAVRAMQAEGRLVVQHGRGVFIAEPPTQQQLREALAELNHDLTNLFAMRGVLEVAGARWAAEIQDQEALRKVTAAYGELEAASQSSPRDYLKLQKLDIRFHQSIVQASGNSLLEQCEAVLEELLYKGLTTTLSIPGRLEKSRSEHAAILNAILSGDADGAAKSAEQHVASVREAALARIAAESAES